MKLTMNPNATNPMLVRGVSTMNTEHETIGGKACILSINGTFWTEAQVVALRGWLALAPVAPEALWALNGKSLEHHYGGGKPAPYDSTDPYIFVSRHEGRTHTTYYLNSASGSYLAAIRFPTE